MEIHPTCIEARRVIADANRFLKDPPPDKQQENTARDISQRVNRVGIALLKAGQTVQLEALSTAANIANVCIPEKPIFATTTHRLMNPRDYGPCQLSGFRSRKYKIPPQYYKQPDTPLDEKGNITNFRLFQEHLDSGHTPGLEVHEVNDMLTLQWLETPEHRLTRRVDLNSLSTANAEALAAQHSWILGEPEASMIERFKRINTKGNPDAPKKRNIFGYYWGLEQLRNNRLTYLRNNNSGRTPFKTLSVLSQEKGDHQTPTLDFRGELLSLDDIEKCREYVASNIDDIVAEQNDTPLTSARDQLIHIAWKMGYDLINDSIDASSPRLNSGSTLK